MSKIGSLVKFNGVDGLDVYYNAESVRNVYVSRCTGVRFTARECQIQNVEIHCCEIDEIRVEKCELIGKMGLSIRNCRGGRIVVGGLGSLFVVSQPGNDNGGTTIDVSSFFGSMVINGYPPEAVILNPECHGVLRADEPAFYSRDSAYKRVASQRAKTSYPWYFFSKSLAVTDEDRIHFDELMALLPKK